MPGNKKAPRHVGASQFRCYLVKRDLARRHRTTRITIGATTSCEPGNGGGATRRVHTHANSISQKKQPVKVNILCDSGLLNAALTTVTAAQAIEKALVGIVQ
ncbi:MAG: hypothetical protein OXF90_13030, partial [Chloroflexi bacterium]|nr:hypothetical protein [Chloroflexota bacterium]